MVYRFQGYIVLMTLVLYFINFRLYCHYVLVHATIFLISNLGSKLVAKWCPPKVFYVYWYHMVLQLPACSVSKSLWWWCIEGHDLTWDLTVPEKSYIYELCCCLMSNSKSEIIHKLWHCENINCIKKDCGSAVVCQVWWWCTVKKVFSHFFDLSPPVHWCVMPLTITFSRM